MKNTTTSLQYEPWLDPRFARDFAFTKAEVALGEAALAEAAFDAPAAPIPVHALDGMFLREEEIGGALSFHAKDIIAVETDLDQADTLAAWKAEVGKALKAMRAWLAPEYRLVPGNPGRHQLTSTANGMKARVFFLFARGLFDPNRADRNAGRYGALLQHLKPGVSKELGTGLRVGMGTECGAYADWDSFYFVRKSSLSVPVAAPIVKVYATEDIAHLATKCAAGSPDPVFKGVALVVPEAHWATVCEGAGITEDPSTLDVIAANGKYVKFADDRTVVDGVTMWMVIPHIDGKRVRLTSEERQLDALRPEMVGVLAETRRQVAEELARAYTEYGKGDAQPLVHMVAKAIEDLADLTAEELCGLSVEEREDIDALFNSAGRVKVALETGLPLPAAEVVALFKPLLEARVKGIRVEGIAAFSMPSNAVGAFGCALNAGAMKRLSLTVGDTVTDIRYPNTGSGMLSLEVKAKHYLPAVAADPRTGATYQAEDYDGDISFVVPVALVDNEKIVVMASKNTKKAPADDATVASTFVGASFGKLNVGATDAAITRMIGRGYTGEYLRLALKRLQALIDLAKQHVEIGEPIAKALDELGIGKMPAALKVQKGRVETAAIAGVSAKRSVSLLAPLYVAKAYSERTAVDRLFRPMVEALPVVIAENHGAYLALMKDDSRYSRELLSEYDAMLGKAGCADLAGGPVQKHFEYRDFPAGYAKAFSARIQENLSRLAVSGRVVKLAFRIHQLYREHTEMLSTDQAKAYELLRTLRANLLKTDQELAGEAMMFLFWALAGRNSKRVYDYVCELAKKYSSKEMVVAKPISDKAMKQYTKDGWIVSEETDTNVCFKSTIHTKSAAMLASLPTMLGKYNLGEMVARSGYVRTPGIRVRRYRNRKK